MDATDVRDCGGRLGPYIEEGRPDLRNIELYFQRCYEGDMIIVVSDGVHDNLDPQILGVKPSDPIFQDYLIKNGLHLPVPEQNCRADLISTEQESMRTNSGNDDLKCDEDEENCEDEKDDWECLENKEIVMKLKNMYREKLLEDIILGRVPTCNPRTGHSTKTKIDEGEAAKTPIKTPLYITQQIIQHCNNITSKGRSFMEKYPGKPLPSNYGKFPGKMDHTTCVCIRVPNTFSTSLNPVCGPDSGGGGGGWWWC